MKASSGRTPQSREGRIATGCGWRDRLGRERAGRPVTCLGASRIWPRADARQDHGRRAGSMARVPLVSSCRPPPEWCATTYSACRSLRRSPMASSRRCSPSGAFGPQNASSPEVAGVWTTTAGYAGGHTPNPTYEEVCSSATGRGEAVLVVFDSATVSYEDLFRVLWESADPIQGMHQNADVGAQYRSDTYTYSAAQHAAATGSKGRYAAALQQAGRGPITTEIVEGPPSAMPRTATSGTWEEPQRCPRARRDGRRQSRRIEHRPAALDQPPRPPSDHGTGLRCRTTVPGEERSGRPEGQSSSTAGASATRSSPTCEDRSRMPARHR